MKIWRIKEKGLILHAESPDGGIGRRAGLKHQWSNPCRFDPGSGYARNFSEVPFLLESADALGWLIPLAPVEQSVPVRPRLRVRKELL